MRARLLCFCLALLIGNASKADSKPAPGHGLATARQYGPHTKCPHYTLPASLKAFAVPATEVEAAASGLVSGSYAGIKPAGQGGVCAGEVFKISRAGLNLWRVSSKSSKSRLGGWWSLEKSDDHFSSRKSWRVANEVWRDWNPEANLVFSCTPAKGELILIGPGQSANCADTSINPGPLDKPHYPESSQLQVNWNGWRKGTPFCSSSIATKRWTDTEGRAGSGRR